MVASLLAAERIIAATYAHNQNYYQQSAKRSGGSVRHERTSYDRPYRTAAAELAGLVNAAFSVKRAADSLSQAFRTTGGRAAAETTETGSMGPVDGVIVRRARRLVDAYNEMHERALAEDGYLARTAAKRGLDQAADGYRVIGIVRGSNGGMLLDEKKFAQALGSRYEEMRHAVAGPYGLTEWLKRTTEQFDQVSPFAMLNARSREFRAYAAYRPVSGLYLQAPVSGMLIDATF